MRYSIPVMFKNHAETEAWVKTTNMILQTVGVSVSTDCPDFQRALAATICQVKVYITIP